MGRALPAKVAVERRKVLCIMCRGGKVQNVRSHPTRIRRLAHVIIRERHSREIAAETCYRHSRIATHPFNSVNRFAA